MSDPAHDRSSGLSTLPGMPRSLRSGESAKLDRATDLVTASVIVHEKRYEVVERIGEGGMGKIYRAYDPVMDRYVALKILKLDVPEQEQRRFRREAVIAANFSHPNLPRVLDVGTMENGVEWMALEYLRGRDLGQVVEKNRRVAFPLLIDIFRQTLHALEYIHVRRIAHCDVKPDNIFITRDSYNRRLVMTKLIDFGIARNLEPPFELQRQISGDPRYMAPEQSILNGPLDHRADLYALGITMFEVLTGRHPFPELFDGPIRALIEAQRTREIPPPSQFLGADAPPELVAKLDAFIAKACAKNPEHRFADAAAMEAALVQLMPAGAVTSGLRSPTF